MKDGTTVSPGSLLIPILECGEFLELRRFALMVREKGGRDSVFFFLQRSYRRLSQDTARLSADGFPWLDHTGTMQLQPRMPATDTPLAASPQRSRFRVLAPDLASAGWVCRLASDLARFMLDLWRYWRLGRTYGNIIRRLRPACVVAGQDFAGSEISVVFAVARREGISRLIVPFAMFNREENRNFALARQDHHIGGRPLNWLLPRVRSGGWTVAHAGRRLCRLRASRALALEVLGLAPGKPWVPCDGAAQAIAAGGEAARASMIAMGLDADRLHVTGAPVHDHLHLVRLERSRLRETLLERTGQGNSECVVLCAWPPVQTVHETEEQEFATYTDLGAAWAEALARLREQGCAVVVKAHPKAFEEELAAARSSGLAVVDDDTADLLPLCDVFATTASSVTAWAIALGIPVVDYDCHRLEYNDFSMDGGVLKPRTIAEFTGVLDRLAFDRAFREEVAGRQAARAGYWGNIDGMAGDRLVALLESLMKTGAHHAGEPS